MSKELRCPCCGSTLIFKQEGKNIPVPECPNCPFRCGTHYCERISAAMDLAKENVLFHKSKTTPSFMERAREEINEIAKCPYCGDRPVEHGRDSYSEIGISCCGVTIWSKENPKIWNQYAAAMELAKECVKHKGYHFSLPAPVYDAQLRVLEVFK